MATTISRGGKIGSTLLAAFALGGAGCMHATRSPGVAEAPHAATSIPLRQPRPGVLTAGQPEAGDWKAIAGRGVSTVVNLRMPGELAGRDVAAEVDAAGMRYVSIPVEGAGGLTHANALLLRAALASAVGPVLVHCASGNRAGALLALDAATDGLSAEQALELGRAAGMTSTEPRVRELLGLPPAP